MVIKINNKKVLFSTPLLKVLDILLLNPDLQFSDSDIGRMKIGAKRSAINSALHALAKVGLVERNKRGQTAVNRLIQTNPTVTHLKIVSNLLTIEPLLKKWIPCAHKIVLFGSRADGTHTHDSDFDLLVVTNDKIKIQKLTNETKLPLQLILKLPEEMMRLHETEPVLWKAISRGIILWEKM